jgi:peptidoglycan/LPS O-acetylase OafA/YrhL
MTQVAYHQETNSVRDKFAGFNASEVTESGRIGLDLLRVLAIVLLVLYHVACLTETRPSGLLSKVTFHLGQMGFIGTDLLLALSGFLAVGGRARAKSAGRWLLWRWWRVFPVLAAFLLLYLYGVPYLLNALGLRVETLPNYADLEGARSRQWTMWTMTSNFLMVTGRRMGAALEPLLTLAVGAQLTVIVACLLPSPRRLLMGIGIIAILGIFLRAVWFHADPYVPYSFPLTRADGFLVGAGFSVLLRSEQRREWLLAIRHRLLLTTTVLLLGLLVSGKGLSITSSWMKLLGYPVVSLWSASVVLVLSQISTCPFFLRRISGAGRGAFVAYLVKLPVTFLVLFVLNRGGGGRSPSFLLFALLSILASGLLGWLGYLAFERPCFRLCSLLPFTRK